MSVLKNSLERALPIVAAAYGEQFGVNVVLSGSDAKTDGETIVLPLLDNASELKDVLFGYLAHEAAHVRDTDFEVFGSCRNAVTRSFLNIIEDIRIERLIQEVFPGTQFTLDAMWTHVVNEGMTLPSNPEDNEASQLHQYLLHRLRADVLKRDGSIALFEASKEVVEESFSSGFFVRLDGLLMKYIDDLSSTKDCLRLTEAILKALKESENDENDSDDDHSEQSGTGSDDSPQESDDGESDEQSNNGEGNNQASTSQSKGDESSGSQAYENIINETDLPDDAIESLKQELRDEASEDNDGQIVAINASSAGGDELNCGEVGGLQSGILASSSIRSKLLGLLQAQNRSKQFLHTRGRRVEGKRLTRLAFGDSRVFISSEHRKEPETSVHVLLDASSSMGSYRQDVANQATVSLALAISSIPKCDIGVSMFPGVGGDVSPIVRRGQQVRPNVGRFAVVSSGCTPLAEAMLYAARDLAVSKRERKVLIVITDGSPNNGNAVTYLNNVIAKHIDTYAIGIGTDAVSQYFKKWSVIEDVNELQSALFKLSSKIFGIH